MGPTRKQNVQMEHNDALHHPKTVSPDRVSGWHSGSRPPTTKKPTEKQRSTLAIPTQTSTAEKLSDTHQPTCLLTAKQELPLTHKSRL